MAGRITIIWGPGPSLIVGRRERGRDGDPGPGVAATYHVLDTRWHCLRGTLPGRSAHSASAPQPRTTPVANDSLVAVMASSVPPYLCPRYPHHPALYTRVPSGFSRITYPLDPPPHPPSPPTTLTFWYPQLIAQHTLWENQRCSPVCLPPYFPSDPGELVAAAVVTTAAAASIVTW